MTTNRIKTNNVQVAAAPIMIKGLKAEHHMKMNALKRQRCPFDAGFDVYPDHADAKVDHLGTADIIRVGTSVHFCFPMGAFGYLCERSSSNEKLAGARIRPGYFDAGYTGECIIMVICDPSGFDAVMGKIKEAQEKQLAIAQMIAIPCLYPAFAEWNDKLVPPGRGTNGFGHSDLFVV